MNIAYDYFNLYSARITPKNRTNSYITTDYNSPKHSESTNNKRSNSQQNYISSRLIKNDMLYIKPYEQKNNANYIFNYFKENNNKSNKKNLNKISSFSNLNSIQDNIEVKQRDLLIDKLNKELYKKNHQLYKQNNIISNLKNKILVNKKSDKINISNNIYPNNKLNQINNTIYNIKKSSINKELTSKLKENENFYKKILNENLDSFNYKLSELENKNIIFMKKNQSLKNEILELKQIIKSKKFLSIKPIHEINLYLIKNKKYMRNDKNQKDENFLKFQKIISQYKLKNYSLTNEINLLKTDLQMKKNQYINIKSQYNNKNNKLNEIFKENKIKDKNILIKEKEIENKKNEINILTNKLNQLLVSFEKEKKEKEEIQKLYDKNNKEMENTRNEIEKINSQSLSKEAKLQNINNLSHKIIFKKNISQYNLTWFLITIKNENEIKNYINTFWLSEEDMQQIKNKLNFDNSIINSEEEKDKSNNIKDIENKEVIKKLNNIIEEKEKIINELKIRINENELIKNNSINNESSNSDDNNIFKDKKGFVSMDKYIKIVNQLSEAKMKINELISDKNKNKKTNLNHNFKNINESGISDDFSDFLKNDDNINNMNNIKIFDEKKINKINLNNSDDTNKYLEKYIDDLENKLEKIKNLIKLLIQEMEYTSNINNTLYNLMIVSGYDDQQAVSIIQEKQKSLKKTNVKK